MEKESLQMVVAANVKKYREAKGLSQEKLSVAAGLHHSTVGFLERLKHDPSTSTIQKIADTLGIPEYKLFLRED